jgi:hypothetical protein
VGERRAAAARAALGGRMAVAAPARALGRRSKARVAQRFAKPHRARSRFSSITAVLRTTFLHDHVPDDHGPAHHVPARRRPCAPRSCTTVLHPVLNLCPAPLSCTKVTARCPRSSSAGIPPEWRLMPVALTPLISGCPFRKRRLPATVPGTDSCLTSPSMMPVVSRFRQGCARIVTLPQRCLAPTAAPTAAPLREGSAGHCAFVRRRASR